MDDLEQQLRSSLRDPRRDVGYAADPLPGVRAGMRRRLRRRSVAMAATAVLLVVAAGTAIGGFNRDRDVDQPPVSPSFTSSAVPTPQVSTTASASQIVSPSPAAIASVGTPAASAPASSPASSASSSAAGSYYDFIAADLSFIGGKQGWALGGEQCLSSPCAKVLHTTDGGQTWATVGAPEAYVVGETGLGACAESSTALPCIRGIRFANPSVGYLFGRSFFTTSDGGQHWREESAPYVNALEPSGGDVLRVVTTTDGCPPGCTFVIQKSVVGSPTWTDLVTPTLTGLDARLLRHGDDAFVFVQEHTSGGAGDAHAQIVVSHDRGATWTQRADPCSPVIPNAIDESDAFDAATGADGTLVVLCLRRDNGRATLRISTDAAATFGSPIQLPAAVAPVSVAAGSAHAIVVAVARSGKAELLVTTDGGGTFRTAATAPQPAGFNPTFLAFTTDLIGTWTGPTRSAFWRTADGGATWVKHGFG